MTIAILGGAFNPPHLGHLLIAQQVLQFTSVEAVWLTPCYRHTFDKSLAPVNHRLAMTKLLIKSAGEFVKATAGFAPPSTASRLKKLPPHEPTSNPPINQTIQLCTAEIDYRLSGETIELMTLLTKKYPQYRFSFIIGADNLVGFKRWGRWRELAANYRFLIFPRPGYSTQLADYQLDNPAYQFQLITHPLLVVTNLSSTLIRQRIKSNLPIAHLVPPTVENYLLTHQLYR